MRGAAMKRPRLAKARLTRSVRRRHLESHQGGLPRENKAAVHPGGYQNRRRRDNAGPRQSLRTSDFGLSLRIHEGR